MATELDLIFPSPRFVLDPHTVLGAAQVDQVDQVDTVLNAFGRIASNEGALVNPGMPGADVLLLLGSHPEDESQVLAVRLGDMSTVALANTLPQLVPEAAKPKVFFRGGSAGQAVFVFVHFMPADAPPDSAGDIQILNLYGQDVQADAEGMGSAAGGGAGAGGVGGFDGTGAGGAGAGAGAGGAGSAGAGTGTGGAGSGAGGAGGGAAGGGAGVAGEADKEQRSAVRDSLTKQLEQVGYPGAKILSLRVFQGVEVLPIAAVEDLVEAGVVDLEQAQVSDIFTDRPAETWRNIMKRRPFPDSLFATWASFPHRN